MIKKYKNSGRIVSLLFACFFGEKVIAENFRGLQNERTSWIDYFKVFFNAILKIIGERDIIPNSSDKNYDRLINFISNVAWTHKIQIKQADIYLTDQEYLRKAKIILSAITSSGLIGIMFVNSPYLKIGTALISFFALTINSLDKSKDYAKLHDIFRTNSDKLWQLREDSINVLRDLKYKTDSDENIDERISELEQRRGQIYSELLDPSSKAVKQASDALKKKHDNIYQDEMQDLIPEDLLNKDRKVSQ